MTAEPKGRDASAGFLIIEVVIALAIVALAFGYAFRTLSGSLDRLGRNHNATEALLLAQSTLDRVGYDIASNAGEVRGSTQDGFSWLVETSPYLPAGTPGAAPLVGYQVQVTVGWKERNNARQMRLTTVHLVYPEPGA